MIGCPKNFNKIKDTDFIYRVPARPGCLKVMSWVIEYGSVFDFRLLKGKQAENGLQLQSSKNGKDSSVALRIRI